VVDPYRREALRAEARARRAESRGGVPNRRPGVFEHSRHSVWLLWHLNSVWCLDSAQQSGGSQQKGAGSQLWGTGSVIRGSGSRIRGAGSEIRRDPPASLTTALSVPGTWSWERPGRSWCSRWWAFVASCGRRQHRCDRCRRPCDDICTWATRCCNAVNTLLAGRYADPSRLARPSVTPSPTRLRVASHRQIMHAATGARHSLYQHRNCCRKVSRLNQTEDQVRTKNVWQIFWWNKNLKHAERFAGDDNFVFSRTHLVVLLSFSFLTTCHVHIYAAIYDV